MRYLISLIVLIFVIQFAYAQDVRYKNNIHLKNENDQRFDALVFGVDYKATDGIDTSLKEFEIINHPPSGLHGFFWLPDVGSTILISYRDFRPIPNEQFFYHEYVLDVQRGGDSLYLQWGAFTEEVDSAFICDFVTGDLFFVDMKQVNETTVENKFINKMLIKVWYNIEPLSVSDETIEEDDGFGVFPNPAIDKINIESDEDIFTYKLYSEYGELVSEGTSSSKIAGITIDGLSNGIYFVLIRNSSGKSVFKKFVKWQ